LTGVTWSGASDRPQDVDNSAMTAVVSSGFCLPGVVRARRDDDGFTLVEVVISMVLLTMMLSSAGVLFIGGIKHGAGLQRRQAAVVLAQQAIEAARAVSPGTDAQGCAKLLQGRTKALIDAQWSSAPSGVTSVTDEAWTPSLCGGPIVLPLQGTVAGMGTVTNPVVLGGQAYTITTYVGTCVLTAARDACLRAAAVPGGTTTMFRIVARVTWSGTGCDTGPCVYSTSTLVESSPDPVFNIRGATGPVATADSVCLASGGPGTLNVISNDTGALGRNPVTIVAAPTKGTLNSAISTGIGGYKPNTGATGIDTFTYYDTDVNGVLSATVTVTITLGGC
jgi:prepilin-type N-terminal cleavage/methylation domain-containing protein